MLEIYWKNINPEKTGIIFTGNISKNGQPINIFHKIEGRGYNQGGEARQIQFANWNQNTTQIKLSRGKDIKKMDLNQEWLMKILNKIFKFHIKHKLKL